MPIIEAVEPLGVLIPILFVIAAVLLVLNLVRMQRKVRKGASEEQGSDRDASPPRHRGS